MRLVNGNVPNEGSVEVYYGKWGKVCGNGWSMKEANVICRQLGYPSAYQAWQRDDYLSDFAAPALVDVKCNGQESSIEQCDYLGIFSSYENLYLCDGVTCNLRNTPPGELEF